MANRPSCPRCPARDYASTGTGICTLNLCWPLNRNSVPDVLAVTLVLSCGPIGPLPPWLIALRSIEDDLPAISGSAKRPRLGKFVRYLHSVLITYVWYVRVELKISEH
jgi:hypothetical protein